jgi:hypothetical protein
MEEICVSSSSEAVALWQESSSTIYLEMNWAKISKRDAAESYRFPKKESQDYWLLDETTTIYKQQVKHKYNKRRDRGE